MCISVVPPLCSSVTCTCMGTCAYCILGTCVDARVWEGAMHTCACMRALHMDIGSGCRCEGVSKGVSTRL